MKTKRISVAVGLAVALGYSVLAGATVPIQFDPDGPGPAPAVTVQSFDWAPGNALAVGGNPLTSGLVVGSQFQLLTHARLSALLDSNGGVILFGADALPAGVEITFVGGFGEKVVAKDANGNAVFSFDDTPPAGTSNFFEIWVSSPDADMLAGTGFNNSKRILFGQVTAASGQYAPSTLPPAVELFDQSVDGNQYGAQQTIVGSGATDISVNIISVDPDYFPGFTPDLIDTNKAFFNTSTVTPFKQANPSHLFVPGDAGADGLLPPAASAVPNLGAVNGVPEGTTRDFQLHTDANESFEVGTPTGQCRVTYGGNDRNGNIAPGSFGQACASDKGNTQNCYTFGGQVGAPTANPALGGPFGEHTHHQVSGPAGDFVFHAGTHSSLKSTRISATACKDPGACRQAVANASFKQIDFEGTGSFRNLSDTAKSYLIGKGAPADIGPDNASSKIYYFRVDMDDTGEPGDKASKNQFDIKNCSRFFAADQNSPLNTADPLLNTYAQCNQCADVYQFYICKDQNACEQKDAIYAVRAFLTGGNIQLHRVIK